MAKEMMNNILVSKKFPKLWRKSKVIAILKPCKDSSLPKSYRPISLLCYTYNVLGFRAGKSCTNQLLNLTQYIEDGYEKNFTTCTVFVDLFAAYDTVNHRVLLTQLYGMTEDDEFTKRIGSMMSNRRLYIERNGKKSR